MKAIIKLLRNTLPHLCIMMTGMYITFYAIDFVNPIMNFIYHDMTELMLLILSVMGLILGIILIVESQRERRRKHPAR